METVKLAGIGMVIVDRTAGTLRPRTHVVAMRLGVGYSADTTRGQAVEAARRTAVEAAAGSSAVGWTWVEA